MKKQFLLIAVLVAALAAVLSFASVAAAGGTVKVFILAGQSNMEGHGGIRTIDLMAGDPGSAPLLKKLKNADGSWAVRDDVFTYYKRGRDTVKAPLTVGQGCSDNEIGPELMFGTIVCCWA